MLIPLARSLILVVCTASSLLAHGRAPGAVNLRTRDIEALTATESKTGRDGRSRVGSQGLPA